MTAARKAPLAARRDAVRTWSAAAPVWPAARTPQQDWPRVWWRRRNGDSGPHAGNGAGRRQALTGADFGSHNEICGAPAGVVVFPHVVVDHQRGAPVEPKSTP